MTMDEDTVQNLYRANKVQQKRIKELEDEIVRLKHSTVVNEKICESWAECRELDCPHRRPHKPIEDGGSKCILHTCRTMLKSGYKICVDNK